MKNIDLSIPIPLPQKVKMLNNYNFFKLEKYFFFSKIPIFSLYLNKLIISNIWDYSSWYLILCEKGISCSSDGCRVIIFITIMWIITPMMEGGLCSKNNVHNPQKVADKTIADRKPHYGLCIFNLSTSKVGNTGTRPECSDTKSWFYPVLQNEYHS